ncbi:bifunctional [glutamate--ammonia ligase]-adenylyl-L-tyrosine phosphorylase/[glutamate--ammonia-ligase] adenylyltransferase [Porticoccus sp. W117]|uniref:bifunctional [glutamate--ammonia ligase]-adenylyl-L-tyrosine phosphorylase/[glutamate--ammonia-ligase] adenylyltransferase n=1 Tax=Porticoccus sp. W117 TaxID=3054777 RepID=UPI002598EE80|nr:bifunctional [glutamate--ammonia ligase]-adenylyl-L-tyrosine phosphorylase/[glutamate--ammonia-ligase] adenylyltransferase [Porticoccus sp. W117]MDM3872297.1 bifunctional [glutamate--ammonia ligase]-adenylyl-L-tyrosine phosphorylase/[glutamate--ammonia-ligase] adenylyltransferase [Porticoccus sp. W117]
MFESSPPLQNQWQQTLSRFQNVSPECAEQLQQLCQQQPEFAAQLQLLWSCSDFVADYACQRPDAFMELVSSGDLQRAFNYQQWQQRYRQALAGIDSEQQLATILRQLRNRDMVRIVWRDFSDLADLAETTADMTAMARCCLDSAIDFLYPSLCNRYGVPIGAASGQPQRLVVFGMGKLGAGELNVSSDIDLIFAYPESGETDTSEASSKRSRSNQEFFERLGRQLIQLLDSRTAEGFVFRVDMRLRPYGSSGPLVGSFAAMEQYYQSQGRDWERFAMIKGRPVAGDIAAGEQLQTALKPFVYRKYIDYSAIEALRDIKALIEQEVHRSGAQNDVKRGRGGIREVEFIAQAFQIIRGGRDTRLQQPPLLRVLPILEEEKLLPAGKAGQLADSYQLLRKVEHCLQGIADQQTQRLPDDHLGRERLVAVVGCHSWEEFCERLVQARETVATEFAAVVAEPVPGADNGQQTPKWATLTWQLLRRDQPVSEILQNAGYDQPDDTERTLQALLNSRAVQQMQSSARDRLKRFMPMLLEGCSRGQYPSQLLQRTLALVEAVTRRSAYLLLLTENPQALQQLLLLCAASPWIASQLAAHPSLLDELLDARTLYSARDRAMLADELRQQVLRVPEDDLEAQLEVLRYFKRSNRLRVAACEVTDALPLMQVSDNLTWIAEVLLEQVLDMAWIQMTQRYGYPQGVLRSGGADFLIVGYGKLGGIEMGHSSDLDLVFLYDADPQGSTDGDRSIDNATFYLRLGQRIIHLLTTQTSSGQLYEVDMRLRPSGNSGMLVTSLNAFQRYQESDAWTWEHQALVRARPVAGSEPLAEAFQKVRRDVLARVRDVQQLSADVVEMRDKMRAHLSKETDNTSFDLKQGSGGIVDIEFMVQFAVLAWGSQHPQLLRWSDNIRILETLAAIGTESGALADGPSPQQAHWLIDAYREYRAAGHRAQLQQQPTVVASQPFHQYRQQVSHLWQRLLPN